MRVRPGTMCLAMLIWALLGAADAQPQSAVEHLGPYDLDASPRGHLTVTVTYYVTPDAPDPLGQKTLESWTIRDAGGTVLATEHRVRDTGPWLTLNAHLVKGASKRFLLLGFDLRPTAPGTGATWVFFGFDRANKFRRLGAFDIFDISGKGIRNPQEPNGDISLTDGRFLDVGVWLHYFGMTFHYEYDEERGFIAVNRCSAAENVAYRDDIARDVRGEHARTGDNTVTLFASPVLTGPADRITVAATARIEFLQACVDAPPPLAHVGGQQFEKQAWLELRIDGKRGWVRHDDWERIGMERAG
jgi:hypothetical protein